MKRFNFNVIYILISVMLVDLYHGFEKSHGAKAQALPLCQKGMAGSDRFPGLTMIMARTPGPHGIEVLCNWWLDGGGWAVFQRRGSEEKRDFDLPWNYFKAGFGTFATDFWLGNEKLANLTSHGQHELRVDLVIEGRLYYARYKQFKIEDEKHAYRLTVGQFHGNIWDAMAHSNHMRFSTMDSDNDKVYTRNCALDYGAWWHNNCFRANLNGPKLFKKGKGGPSWFYYKNGRMVIGYPTFMQMMVR